MIEGNDLAGIESQGGLGQTLRPYVKPFVRNLDVLETEGKHTYPLSEVYSTVEKISYGPS